MIVAEMEALVAMGVAVEVFAWADRNRGSKLATALSRPGFAFQRAVDAVTKASVRLLDELVTTAPPRDREREIQRIRLRVAARS